MGGALQNLSTTRYTTSLLSALFWSIQAQTSMTATQHGDLRISEAVKVSCMFSLQALIFRNKSVEFALRDHFNQSVESFEGSFAIF